MPSTFSRHPNNCRTWVEWRCLGGTSKSHAQSSGRWTIGGVIRLTDCTGHGYWINYYSHCHKLEVRLMIVYELRNAVTVGLLTFSAIRSTPQKIETMADLVLDGNSVEA